METKNKVQFVAHGARWFDGVNGNTYHSVYVKRCSDGEVLKCEWQYGYGNHYRQTALKAMKEAGWLECETNEYPIEWSVSDGLKRDMVANGR